MARPRRTVEVKDMLDKLNLRISKTETEEARKELCEFTEYMLFAADRYHGFMYVGGYKGQESYLRRYN